MRDEATDLKTAAQRHAEFIERTTTPEGRSKEKAIRYSRMVARRNDMRAVKLLMQFCRDNKVSHFKWQDFEATFHPSAFLEAPEADAGVAVDASSSAFVSDDERTDYPPRQ